MEQYYTIQLAHARIVEIKHDPPNLESVSFVYDTITKTWTQGAISTVDYWVGP